MIGCIGLTFLLSHSYLLLQPMVFRFRFLQRLLRTVHSAFLSICLPGRSVRQTPVSGISFDLPSNRVDLPVSPFRIPENFSHFRFFHLPLINPTFKRSLFPWLTERSERIFSFSLQHFRCAGPSARMIRLFAQLRAILRFRIVSVTFYRLPDTQMYNY
jgi:hypothetical protein